MESSSRRYKLADLIDTAEVREMMEDFHAITSYPVGILDVDGTILVQVGYRDICTQFHRRHPQTEKRCIESDVLINSRLRDGGYVDYTCGNGLIDAAAPIIIDGEHLANIYTGQFFFEPPDRQRFARQAEQFGFDRACYLRALDQVPVVSRAQYAAVMGFLTRFAALLAKMGLKVKRQREAEAALLQSQKMEAVGRLAGGVAHDFNNLLQGILGFGEELRERLPAQSSERELITVVLEGAERARDLVSQLLVFSREEKLRHEFVALPELTAKLLRLVDRIIGEHIQVVLRPCAEPCAVFADSRQLEQVVLNLCVNARDAMPDGGTITIRIFREELDAARASAVSDAAPGGYAVLEVADTGTGIPKDKLPYIYEPFFTTKPKEKGTGLGLSTVYAVARQHGGFVTVETAENAGSVFRLYLPAAAASLPVAEEHDPDEQPVLAGTETLLLAEDDEVGRRLAYRALSGAGYQVLVARDGEQALQLWRQHQAEIALLVLDVLMPGRNGREVYEAARRQHPRIPVLFCSGYSHDLLRSQYLLSLPAGQLLQKPYKVRELLRVVRALLDQENGR